jgi:hypothetical protein
MTTAQKRRRTLSSKGVQVRRRRKRATAAAHRTLRSYSRWTRRKFLTHTAASGLLLGLSPELGSSQSGRRESRTLFLNLSGDANSAESRRSSSKPFFHIGGRTYRLKSVSEHPAVLERARQGNVFLSLVPDDQITHFLEDASFSSDITELGYIGQDVDPEAGTWSMSMVFQNLPASGLQAAYARAREITPNGPLPLSAKREFYGIDAAFTIQDLQDELQLLDYTDFARTLVALQPDMLCANPAGAQIIATDYIAPNSATRFLARTLQNAGPAMPQAIATQANAQGWATLLPLNQDNGAPFKMADELSHLNQYFPDWNPQVDQQVANAVNTLHRQVKNDPDLGSDITSLLPDSGVVPNTLDPSVAQQLTGKVWYRHDGLTAVNHDSQAFAGTAPKFAYRKQKGEMGLVVTDPAIGEGPDSRVQVTLNNVSNWFLRYLGMYVQFVDANDNVISKANLPADTMPDRGDDRLDKDNALFGGIVSPVYSVAGIPIYPPGSISVLVNVPPQAATLNVFYGGMGGSGSPVGPTGLQDVGASLTAIFNYGLTAIFMAVGSLLTGNIVKSLTFVAQFIIFELTQLMATYLNNNSVPTVRWAWGLMQILLNMLAKTALEALFTALAPYLVAAQAINAIPVAGQIARAAAAVIGGVQLALTTIEVGISPPVYQFDLAFTHDLSVTILPDIQSGSFPQPPGGYVLYYKVNYLFDNGAPHYQEAVDVVDPSVKSISVTLAGIPRGGEVNISVGFYMRKSSTPTAENDWCAGHGTTGLVSNTVDQAPDITIQQIKIPIQSSTLYIHTSKTALTASGQHRWVSTGIAPPYFPPSGGQRPGDLAALRAITVRQATRTQQGYLGYAWQSYSSGVLDCQAGAPGQLDQAANLNTDRGNNGANAQNGYITTPCGLRGGATSGVKLAYNPLTAGIANLYLDPSSLFLREIALDPTPGFSSPVLGQSFGKLNLDSTALLLHPAGHVVSLNNANHKMEALQLPSDPVDDSVAQKRYLARTYLGQGSRPGLITSPVAGCIDSQGTILVLEDSTANNRISAFDLGGNPVRFFTNQAEPYFLYLPVTAGATYLDLAVEFTGYLYVLSRNSDASNFRLDIYHPAQTGTQPICTTTGVNAAKLTVDLWRNVYTLNYEVLKLPTGQIPSLTEPSVSFWVPLPPTV